MEGEDPASDCSLPRHRRAFRYANGPALSHVVCKRSRLCTVVSPSVADRHTRWGPHDIMVELSNSHHQGTS